MIDVLVECCKHIVVFLFSLDVILLCKLLYNTVLYLL